MSSLHIIPDFKLPQCIGYVPAFGGLRQLASPTDPRVNHGNSRVLPLEKMRNAFDLPPFHCSDPPSLASSLPSLSYDIFFSFMGHKKFCPPEVCKWSCYVY